MQLMDTVFLKHFLFEVFISSSVNEILSLALWWVCQHFWVGMLMLLGGCDGDWSCWGIILGLVSFYNCAFIRILFLGVMEIGDQKWAGPFHI